MKKLILILIILLVGIALYYLIIGQALDEELPQIGGVQPTVTIGQDKIINDQECVRAGCSGELCVETAVADEIFTTCEFKPEYSCYQQAVCTRLESGECGFIRDEDFEQCLQDAAEIGTEFMAPQIAPQ